MEDPPKEIMQDFTDSDYWLHKKLYHYSMQNNVVP